MTDLFNRDFTCRIGGAVISIQTPDLLTGKIATSLRAAFKIEKSDASEPNKATIEVWNLSEANRRILQEGASLVAKTIAAAKRAGVTPRWKWPLIVEAGYVGYKSQIFSGDVQLAESKKERSDWVTTIEAEDGGNQYANARINKSFGAGTTMLALLTFAAKSLGIGLGNSLEKFAISKRNIVVFKKGIAISGKVSKILDKYCASAGYRWCIHDGQLQVLAPGETLFENVVILNKSSGLIGSPELGEEGVVSFTSLLQGAIKPGKRIILDSETAKGTFKAERVSHSGDTWGQEWYTEVEAKPV